MLRPRSWPIVMAIALLGGACGGPEGSPSPLPEPSVACINVPQGPCDDAVASLAGSLESPALQINVACVSFACTATDGQLQIDVLLAGGRHETRGSGYRSTEEPVPAVPAVLPVAPICLGVPFASCREMAESAAQGLIGGAAGGGPRIVRITVRCQGVCTPTKGEGETRIDFVDGTNQISGWGYESVGG